MYYRPARGTSTGMSSISGDTLYDGRNVSKEQGHRDDDDGGDNDDESECGDKLLMHNAVKQVSGHRIYNND